ncbi:MAG: TlpA family protein disulfide reductase [Mariprofundus sp.]
MKQLLYLITLGILLSACSSGEQHSDVASMPVKGKAMPAFQMRTLDGKLVKSHDQFAGKVIILNVWATWCPPCRKEMPDLIRLSRLLPSNKFTVIGLAADDNVDDVRAFVEKNNIPFPIFWDKGGKQVAGPVLRVFKYPETFVINRRGVFVEKVIGGFPWASPNMVSILNTIYKTGKIPDVPKNQ